jgi:hypothetical protein
MVTDDEVIVPELAAPKKPTSISFALAVVILGAVIVVLAAFTWPNAVSIGEAALTFVYDKITPEALLEVKFQVYEPDSPAAANFQ